VDEFDLVGIGGRSGGYTAAVRAGVPVTAQHLRDEDVDLRKLLPN